jgi:hypothetical protein
MDAIKFFPLPVSRLSLDEVSGLLTETIDVSTPIVPTLTQPLLLSKLNVMKVDVPLFKSEMHRSRASIMTPELKAFDVEINGGFDEVKRNIKVNLKSSIPAKSAAAKLLMNVYKPFWKITTLPMASQLAQLKELALRVNSTQPLLDAISALGIMPVWLNLVETNIAFKTLYDQRLVQNADTTLPPASKMKPVVVKEYEDYCTTIVQIYTTTPTEALKHLFDEINEVRRKYAPHHLLELDAEHTSSEPIPEQDWTGRDVTPLTRMFYTTDTGTKIELRFTKDFDTAYKNNVNEGDAIAYFRGKGQYTGQYIITFRIVKRDE